MYGFPYKEKKTTALAIDAKMTFECTQTWKINCFTIYMQVWHTQNLLCNPPRVIHSRQPKPYLHIRKLSLEEYRTLPAITNKLEYWDFLYSSVWLRIALVLNNYIQWWSFLHSFKGRELSLLISSSGLLSLVVYEELEKTLSGNKCCEACKSLGNWRNVTNNTNKLFGNSPRFFVYTEVRGSLGLIAWMQSIKGGFML